MPVRRALASRPVGQSSADFADIRALRYNIKLTDMEVDWVMEGIVGFF